MSNPQHPATSNVKTTVNIQTIYQVLEIKASINQNDILKLSEKEKEYYQMLPQVDKAKIDKLKRDLQIYPPDQVLSHFPEEYQQICYFNSIERICILNENKKQILKPMAVFIFFNMISLLYFNPQQEITVRIMIFTVKSLAKCLYSFQRLSSLFFQDLITKNLESQKSELNKKFYQTVFEFIKINSSIDKSFYQTFVNLCKEAFAINDNEFTSDIFDLILLLFNEKRLLVKIEDQSPLLNCLQPFLDNNDPKIFNILSAISMISKCQALQNIYSKFGSLIMEKVSDLPITIGHQNECDDLPSVELTNRDQYNFVGTEVHTFPEGFKPLPPQFSEKYDISQHFPPSIWEFCTKISNLLKSSNVDVADTFFSQLMSMIQAETNSNLLYTHIILLLMFLKENATPSRLLFSKIYLTSEKIFNPKCVIFNEGGLDPIINYLRNEIVLILADKDPEILMEIMVKKNTYLYVELLGRLLCMTTKLNNFSSYNTFFTDIIDVSTYLQAVDFQYHSDKLTTIRSVIFSFTTKLAKFPDFLETDFVRGFINFIFEVDITDQILFIFKMNFSLCHSGNKFLPLIERFSTILHICASRSANDERYLSLAYKITEMINTSLKHSMQTIELAYQLFDVIYQCFKANPKNDFLLLILSLLRIISSWKEDFSLNQEKITFISTYIKTNKLFSKSWFVNFLTLMTNSYVPPQNPNALNQFYFIERPQFILIFLASFGISPQFPEYLGILSLNSQVSPYNSRNCHDGCLDIVLLKFLAEGKEECTVTHRGISMDLKIPVQAQKDYVFPLLVSMFSSKTSYSVVVLLHKLCRMKDVNFLTVFESAMAACALRHSPYYLISSLPVENSSEISVNSGKFSIGFWFKLDALRIIRTRPVITFFSLSDKKSTLSLSFSQNKFYLINEIPKEKPSRQSYQFFPLDRTKSVSENIIAANLWHFLGISFSVVDGKQMAWIYIDDNQLRADRQVTDEYVVGLHPINFLKGKVELQIGTVKTNDPQRCRELGYIAEFCYFPRTVRSDEFHEYCLQRPFDEQDIVDVRSKSSYFHSKTLLEIYDDSFVLNQFMNALSIVLEPDFLYSLKYILNSVPQQLKFSMTDDVLDCVLKMKPHDSSLYLTVYSIFEVISDERLIEEWIRTLIFNLSLWMKNDQVSKYTILCHWTSTLIQNYASIFKSMSKFSDVLLSFESISKDDGDDFKYEYIKLLSKLAFLNFKPENMNDLFTVTMSSCEKPLFIYYLKLIRNIANIVSPDMQKKMILYLHKILKKPNLNASSENGIKIVHELLLTLHDLSALSNVVMESTTLLRLLPHTNISESVVFHDLLDNLNEFPGFYPLLCGLASISKKVENDEQAAKDDREKIAKELLHLQSSLFPQISRGSSNQSFQKTTTPSKLQNSGSASYIGSASKQQQAKVQSVSSSSPRQSTLSSVIGKSSNSHHIDAAEAADKGYKLKMMYSDLWFLWPIIFVFKINGFNSQMFLFDFLANGTNDLVTQNEKINAIQNICSLLTYMSAGYQINSLASKYLIALHDLVPSNETQVLSEIVNQLVFISFLHISPHTHNSVFIKEFVKSPFYSEDMKINYMTCSAFPTINLNTISDIDSFASERKVPTIGIEHIFDDKENFIALPTFQIAMKVLNDSKIKSDYTDIVNYFAQKKNDGSCNKHPNLFDKMRTIYTDQFSNVTSKLFGNMSRSLVETKSTLTNINNVSFDQVEKDAASLVDPIKELQPRPQLTNILDFCRSRVLSPSYPTKIKKRLFSRPTRKNSHYQLKKADLTITNASLVNIRKSRHCEFQLSKEFVRIIVEESEKMFKMNEISLVFIFETSVEFHTYTGRSYLIDMSRTNQNTAILTKYFADYQIAKPSPSKWTSNFEYLMYLNHLSGRSFNRTKQYPIFPNVLVNYSDYMCRNVASLNKDSIKIKTQDMNFLRWTGSLYVVTDVSVSSMIENDNFLPPEFYYFPELFGDCRLPPWASNKFEFVYKMRKLLESPSVTKNLPKWIDMIWSDKEYIGTKFDHKVVFHVPHKPKETYVQAAPKLNGNHSVEVVNKTTVVFSICHQKTLGIISNDRQIQFFLIGHENGQVTFKKAKSYQLEMDVSKYVFFCTNNVINAFNKDTMSLTRYDSKNIIDEKTIYCEIPVFRKFDKSFVYSEDFSTIRTESGIPYRSENEIICFAASARFGFLAYATVDNVVHITNIPKGKSDIPRKLTGIPLRLLITESWGFVVVQTQGEITILDQNGELIKTVKFEYDMNYWTTFSSASGFDYILFRYRVNALCMFEAMYPEHISFVCEANDMINVHYNHDTESLLIVNKLGKVAVDPISLSSMFK